MRPPVFDYVRASDLEHALALLVEHGPEAKIVAGGQSLIPMLNMRLAAPAILIDISRIGELRFVEAVGDTLRIGAGVKHAEIEYGELGEPARRLLPVLGEAASLIGHHPIRTRGTFGGSIAHADSTSEWCLAAQLLDATVTVRSLSTERLIPAADFFHGFLRTALEADEIVTEIGFATLPSSAKILEFTRRHGDFPVVSAGAAVTMSRGECAQVAIALGGVAETPVRITQAEELFSGSALTDADIRRATSIVEESIEPPADIHGSADYRRQLAGVLTKRALVAVRDDISGAEKNG